MYSNTANSGPSSQSNNMNSLYGKKKKLHFHPAAPNKIAAPFWTLAIRALFFNLNQDRSAVFLVSVDELHFERYEDILT